jgi:hypothetical protein
MSEHQNKSSAESSIWFGIGIVLGFVVLAYIAKPSIFHISLYLIKKTLVAIYYIEVDLGMDVTSITNSLITLDNNINHSDVSYHNSWAIYTILGSHIVTFAVTGLVLALAYILITYYYENYFNRTFGFVRLKKEYAKMNPKILPTQAFPPFTKNEDKEPFTQSETPWVFANKYKIIKPSMSSTNVTRDSFDEDIAKKVLQTQCGAMFHHPIVDSDNKIHMTGAAKIMLGIMCAYHEREPLLMKELVNESGRWFKYKINMKTKKHKFWMEVPKKYEAEIDRLIIQAFTNSVSIDSFERQNKLDNNEPMMHKVIRSAYYVHDFTYTFLMALFDPIPQVSASDTIWLKAINRPLYYALNIVGRPSPLTRSLGIRYLYFEEKQKFKNKSRLFEKDLVSPVSIDTKVLLDMHNWDSPINDLYFALDDTQWVHHSRYKDIEDEDIINLGEKDFSFDNQAYILIIKELQERQLKVKSLHFKKYDGSYLMDPIYPNESEIMDIKDAARLKAIIGAFYVNVNDMQALKYFCYTNSETLKDINIVGYNMLPDAVEVMGSSAKSWYNIMKEVMRINEDDTSGVISPEDLNWGVINSIEDAISTLYELPKQ